MTSTDITLPRNGDALPNEHANQQIPFLRYIVSLAFRWKKVIGSIIGACLLIGIIVTLLMTREYTATTTVEIARESDKIVNIQGVRSEATDADQEFYQTQYGLLKARSLAERIATRLNLTNNRAFFEMFDTDMDKPAFATDAKGVMAPQQRGERLRVAGNILLDNVTITPLRSSRLVDISFTSPDPVLSAKVSNAWSADFIEATLQRRYDANSYARNFLEGRLSQLRERLEVSEKQLVAYAASEQIINLPNPGGSGERSLLADDLSSLNGALTAATAQRLASEAKYKATLGSNGSSAEALVNPAINTLRSRRADLSADYQRLMAQFEPGYPAARALQAQIAQIDKSLAREEGRIQQSIENAYREAQGREAALSERVNGLKSGILDLRRRTIQYAIYQREVDTNRQLYDALLQRYKEIGIAGGVGVNNVAVVDPADVPQRPSSPRIFLNMLLALLSGVALGGIAAFLLEQSDEAIIDPTQVERLIGLPLLGSVPKLDSGTPVEALLDRKSEMVDAYLAVQTNLAFATAHGFPYSISVTSTRPTEGKSTTAFALAAALARAGKRTILVDGDMRSPSVHHLIGTDHKRGLSNYLAGDDDLKSQLIDVPAFGFTAMTGGPIPPNAGELLTSDRLKLLLERLREQFDHVVIDSPPIMGLADAPLIGTRVEGVVYAVEAHGIRSSLVRTAIGRLASANARILGAVLTKFEARRGGGYGYGYGYEYGYSYGRDGKSTNEQR